MKNCMLISGAMVVWFGTIALGQVGTVRVVNPHEEYFVASSPIGDGRTITTYYLPQNPTALARLAPLTTPQVVYQPTSRIVPIAGLTQDPYYGTTTVRPIGACCGMQRPTIAASPIGAAPIANCCGAYSPYVSTGYAPAPMNAYSAGYRFRPIVPINNLPSRAYLGQGLLGQPKAYVSGQPVRNLFRYITP